MALCEDKFIKYFVFFVAKIQTWLRGWTTTTNGIRIKSQAVTEKPYKKTNRFFPLKHYGRTSFLGRILFKLFISIFTYDVWLCAQLNSATPWTVALLGSFVHRISQARILGWVAICFSSQGLNLCLLHWQTDSLPLSHQGSPSLVICAYNFLFVCFISIRV